VEDFSQYIFFSISTYQIHIMFFVHFSLGQKAKNSWDEKEQEDEDEAKVSDSYLEYQV